MQTAEPFRVCFDEARLEDLDRRLAATRFPLDRDNRDWSYGVEIDYLRELLEYWREGFDWAEVERRLNSVAHFRTELGGVPIHFVQERGRGPQPLPLVLTHGWPWTFWDFHELIGPLVDPAAHGGDPADAFDVVVPSLPGFAFSTPLGRAVDVWEVADLWVELMTGVLGYERFGAHGGDLGGLVTAQLGHAHAGRVLGVHFAPRLVRLDAYNLSRPWAGLVAGTLPQVRGDEAGLIGWEEKRVAHAVAHLLCPETLAVALNDSPAGLAAWLLERRRSWSDCGGDVESAFSRDELLTGIALYWLTECFAGSARIYRDNWQRGWRPAHRRSPVIEAPTGVALFRADLPPGAGVDWMAEYADLRRLTEIAAGGHFAAAEQPGAVVEDLRAFFRPLREGA